MTDALAKCSAPGGAAAPCTGRASPSTLPQAQTDTAPCSQRSTQRGATPKASLSDHAEGALPAEESAGAPSCRALPGSRSGLTQPLSRDLASEGSGSRETSRETPKNAAQDGQTKALAPRPLEVSLEVVPESVAGLQGSCVLEAAGREPNPFPDPFGVSLENENTLEACHDR